MSAPRIYLDRFPSFSQKYRNWWKFDEVLTKTNLLSFFWDTVYFALRKKDGHHIGILFPVSILTYI